MYQNNKEENWSERARWIKEGIDIELFIQSRGYTIDKERDCPRYRAYHCQGADKIVVPAAKGSSAKAWFFPQHDSSAKGDIINFVMDRECGHCDKKEGFKQAVEILEAYMAKPSFVAYDPESKENKKSNEKAQRVAAYHKKYIQEFITGKPSLKDSQCVEWLGQVRGISVRTLNHKAFKGRLMTAVYNKSQHVVFPMFGEDNTIKALAFKSLGYQKTIGERGCALWVSGHTLSKDIPVDNIYFTEHPLNAMSHFQLYHQRDENNLYVCFMGSPAWQQLSLMQKLIDTKNPKYVVLSNDKDEPKGKEVHGAGTKYDLKMNDYFTFNKAMIILKPRFGSDFNDELREVLRLHETFKTPVKSVKKNIKKRFKAKGRNLAIAV